MKGAVDADGVGHVYLESLAAHGVDAQAADGGCYVTIANAKYHFRDMFHGIQVEFLQYYLDGFCHKFNRMYSGDRMFYRIVLVTTSYRPSFKYGTYGSEQCG